MKTSNVVDQNITSPQSDLVVTKEPNFFPVELYPSALPLIMQYLPFTARFNVEETCQLWQEIGTSQGWADVKRIRLRKSDWTEVDDDSWEISLSDVVRVAERVKSVRIIEINEYYKKQFSMGDVLEQRKIAKEFITCSVNSLVEVNLQSVQLNADLASCLVPIKTLRELTLRSDAELGSYKYLSQIMNRLTVFRLKCSLSSFAKSYNDGRFLETLNPDKIKALELDCFKINLVYLSKVLTETTDNLQELKLYDSVRPYQVLRSFTEKERPALEKIELKIHYYNENSFFAIEQSSDIPKNLYNRLVLAAPNLKELKISYEQQEYLMSVETLSLMSQNLQNLELLNLTNSRLNENNFEAVTSNLTNLKIFVIDVQMIGDVTFKFLSNLPNLHTLRIRGIPSPFGDYKSMYHNIFTYALKQLNLVTLDLRGSDITYSVEQIDKLIPRLSPLTVYLNNRMRYDYLQAKKGVKLGNHVLLDFEYQGGYDEFDNINSTLLPL